MEKARDAMEKARDAMEKARDAMEKARDAMEKARDAMEKARDAMEMKGVNGFTVEPEREHLRLRPIPHLTDSLPKTRMVSLIGA